MFEDIIDGKLKWNVNAILDEDSKKIGNSGYFGVYTLIKYKGKKAIVYHDDRDAIVNVRSGWHDDILYGMEFGCDARWDGDNRWNNDLPIVVKDNGLFNMVAPHKDKLIFSEWFTDIETKWKYKPIFGRYHFVKATKTDGTKVLLFENGNIIPDTDGLAEEISTLMSTLNAYTANDAEKLWVNMGNPCYHIVGLEYKGAKVGEVSTDEAKVLIKTHRRFGNNFNSLEWRVIGGRIVLLFRDYCNSDYD